MDNTSQHPGKEAQNSPLYVDLDGTFIKSDMLLESFLAALKDNILVCFWACLWLLKGKAYLKYRLFQVAQINVATIPVNPETFAFLEQQKKRGRTVFLATASNERIADAFVKAYPDIFDGYIASSDTHNLKGPNKLSKILEQESAFAYMGNSIEDYTLFERAAEAYLVAPTNRARRADQTDALFTNRFDMTSDASLKAWIKQLRIYQWLKNGLIFVPLLVSNHFTDLSALLATSVAFLTFGLLASSTYVLNDLLDLEADRQHARKRFRPLAACILPLHHAALVAFVLFVLALAIGYLLSPLFLLTLIIYLVLTLSYSFKLKRYFAMDVIALASLYTIRIFAGAAVIGVTVSFWLLGFSMFVFLSLALVKRCAELVALKQKNQLQVAGRDYNVNDLMVFTSFGSTSSMISLLMYCFYLNSDVLKNQYQEPQVLWLALPCLGYWLMRMWVKTLRGEMHDDPIIFSLKDKGSVIAVFLMLILTVSAQLL